MTMTLDEGFKMLKREDMLNPQPKRRMYFWYGGESVLVLDKAKVTNGDIVAALGNKPPKPPFCLGRIGLYDENGQRLLRVATSGSSAGKLVKDLKVIAPKYGLRDAKITLEEATPQDDEAPESAQAVADQVTLANRQKLAKAVADSLARAPNEMARKQLRDRIVAWQQEQGEADAMSSDDLARAIDRLATLEHAVPQGQAGFQDQVVKAGALARDRRPQEGAAIATLVREALEAHKANQAQVAQHKLDQLKAMSNQNVVTGDGGGDFEQQLLAAAKTARTKHPAAQPKIADLVMRAREQQARGTQESREAARALLQELKVFDDQQGLGDGAMAKAALDRLTKSVNAAVNNGTLTRKQTAATDDLNNAVIEAKKAFEKNNFSGALEHIGRGERLLAQAEGQLSDLRDRQEATQRRQAAQQQYDEVQQHVSRQRSRDGKLSGYTEGAELGRGGNGKVSMLVPKSKGPQIVLKTPILRSNDPGFLAEEIAGVNEDMQREADVAAAIGPHPNIAQVYGTVETDGVKGLLMEPIRGGDMAGLNQKLLDLRKSGKLTEEQYWGAVQFTFKRMVEALDYMSEKNFVHGDIKPANVMIDAETGEPKLIDLGSVARKGERAGADTAAYKAPEKSSAATTSRDMFATGATAFEVGSGNTGKDAHDKLFDHGGQNFASNWGTMNQRDPNDPNSIPADWRALAAPALKLGDNATPGKEAFTTRAKIDPKTGTVISSEAEKKHGVYAADTAYVDFVNRLMHPDPRQRLTPRQALEHPFMRQRMLADEEAKAVIRGVVAPADDEADTPLRRQYEAMRKLEKETEAATEDATERTQRLDKLVQLVQAEAIAATSGARAKPNPAIADEKVAPLLRASSERLGRLQQAARELQASAEGFLADLTATGDRPDAKKRAARRTELEGAVSAAIEQAKAADAAHRLLAATCARMDEQLRERRKARP